MKSGGLVLALLILAGNWGCGPALENAQANLTKVEARFRVPTPTHADYFELGMARYRVWRIYLVRSRHRAGMAKGGVEAESNRRHAKRLEPQVIEAFWRAMDNPPDLKIAARAKKQLSLMYAQMPDLNKQIGILKRFLREHGDDQDIVGMPNPRYYGHYTLAGLYQAQGRRGDAIDALARALLALDKKETAGVDVGDGPAYILGRLLAYEPRIVLARYQRLLPADINEGPATPKLPKRTGPAAPLKRILRSHRKTAPIRVTLTVEHAGRNGVLVSYRVVFPDYSKRVEAWRRHWQNPPRLMGDEFPPLKPTFGLSFSALPATDGFSIPDYVKEIFSPVTATGPLVFDPQGRTAGKMILKWSDKAPRRLDLYLVATLKLQTRRLQMNHGWVPGDPSADQVYMAPLRVTIDRDATKLR